MSDIFISYKREDEAPVARLVRALERAGHSVWWDRSLAGGENWRAQIQSALEDAKCVIVAWTGASVGPAGDFVRDEAAHAKNRGVLVPVKLGKVDPPLGFGEIQAIDLTRWKGSAGDPFFKDLLDTIAAKIAGCPVPPAKGPAKWLIRRLSYSGFASAAVFCAVLFGSNSFHAQDRTCGMPLFQPRLSDFCGALELGGRPAKSERIAWAKRQAGSCAALRAHLEHFPNGAYRDQANSLLQDRVVTQQEVWTPATHQLALFASRQEVSSPKIAAAQFSAIASAQPLADHLCKGFAATTSFRLKSAKPVPREWDCASVANGVICGFEGEAVCDLEERRVQESETCGK